MYDFLKFTDYFIVFAYFNTILSFFIKKSKINYILFSGIFYIFIYLVLRFFFRKEYKKYNIKFKFIWCCFYFLLLFLLVF